MSCPCLFHITTEKEIEIEGKRRSIFYIGMPEDELDVPAENIKLDGINAFEYFKDFDDGDRLRYIFVKEDKIDGQFNKPVDIDVVERDGKDFVAVMWKRPTHYDSIKMYEVNGHFVYAGCSVDEATIKNGKMKCEEKDLYIVLHPIREWADEHIVDINEK